MFSFKEYRTSLVVQWLRICLPMQVTWTGKIPLAPGQLTCAPQLLNLSSRARELQL